MTDLTRLLTVDDVERASRRHLPRPIFDVLAGGADDEQTLGLNRRALAQLRLVPRVLRDVRERDLSTSLFGERYALPVLLAPVGYQRLLHAEGERASARAAAEAGVVSILSGGSSCSPEDVAAEAPRGRWYQLYPEHDRAATRELLGRVAALGYSVLCVTIDTPMHAVRERDVRNRLTMPLRPTVPLVASALLRPRWTRSFLSGGAGRGLEASRRFPATRRGFQHVASARTGRVVTADDLAWLRATWQGPLVVKGVLHAGDVDQLLELGVDGIVVSNHGGRQLDAAPATIDVLPEFVEAVAGRATLLIDGGFRRGSDVVKALAIGADGVLIGRPYAFGLSVAGAAGVGHVLDILAAEIGTTLGLLGARAIADLDPSMVRGPGAVPGAGLVSRAPVTREAIG